MLWQTHFLSPLMLSNRGLKLRQWTGRAAVFMSGVIGYKWLICVTWVRWLKRLLGMCLESFVFMCFSCWPKDSMRWFPAKKTRAALLFCHTVILSVCSALCLSSCLSVCLIDFLTSCWHQLLLSVCLCVCLSVCLSLCLSVCLSILYLAPGSEEPLIN